MANLQYKAYTLMPGVVKCGKCFRGRIRRYRQRCKVCGAMNLADEFAPKRPVEVIFPWGESLIYR